MSEVQERNALAFERDRLAASDLVLREQVRVQGERIAELVAERGEAEEHAVVCQNVAVRAQRERDRYLAALERIAHEPLCCTHTAHEIAREALNQSTTK